MRWKRVEQYRIRRWRIGRGWRRGGEQRRLERHQLGDERQRNRSGQRNREQRRDERDLNEWNGERRYRSEWRGHQRNLGEWDRHERDGRQRCRQQRSLRERYGHERDRYEWIDDRRRSEASAACATYCADIEGACAATQDKQYASAAECLTACAILEASNVATGMDTIVCRRTEATDAIKGPLPHCWRAGPYGYDVCGDQCEAFCILADSACASTYADCKTTCATFTKVPAPTTVAEAAHVYTSSGPTTGNTLDCREYYLGLAVEGTDKATACANAGEASPKCK